MKYLNALNLINGLGPQKMKRLIQYFGSAEAAWKAEAQELLKSGIGSTVAERLTQERTNIDPDAEWEKLNKNGIKILTLADPSYPALLREIPSAPYILYTRGPAENMNSQPMLAIVGSRKYSNYGERVAYRLAFDLAKAGITIVSGLAIGVDGRAHHLAVEKAGHTWGVLPGGCDWDSLSPSRHRHLDGRMVMGGGGIMSEFPIGTPSLKNHFPVRNRIISGMARATLVVEAAEKSGSLITARSALDQNREVLAVPGPITSPLSLGPNRLIRQGAHAVTCAKDILEVLNVEPPEDDTIRKPLEPQNATEAALLAHLTREPKHVDDLARESSLPTPLVLSTLTALELRDGVVEVGGNRYRRK